MTRMRRSSFKKFSKGDIKGWMIEEIFHALPSAFFQDPVSSIQRMEGKIIKESKLRWAALLTLPSGRRIFLKRDKTKGWFESLKYLLLPSKARKEWFVAFQLHKRKLNIPKPLGWLERVHRGFVKESYYFSEAIGPGLSLREDIDILKDEAIWTELARTVRKINDSGLFHKDLHAGNILWDGKIFFLTDLHNTRILKTLSLNQRLWNLSHLFHSLRSLWGREEHLRFLGKYFEEESLHLQNSEGYLRKIHSWMDLLQKRQWKSRAKRCLRESTDFSIKKENGTTIYHRKNFPLGSLKRVIGEHLALVRERPSALAKLRPGINVSILEGQGEKVCVKQFCYPQRWDRLKVQFRRSKGLKAWLGGNGLRARGISSIKPLGLVEKRNWFGLIESFLIMETSKTGEELDRYILMGFGDFKEKRLFVKSFAKWLSHLHQTNLYHKDMKTSNILVSEEEGNWDFFLLDLEDIQLNGKVDEKRVLRNFIQLHTSTPKVITGTDRIRFLKEYICLHPIIKDRKVFIRQLIEESRERGSFYLSS